MAPWSRTLTSSIARSAEPLKWPAALASMTLPVTGVPAGIRVKPFMVTLVAVAPWKVSPALAVLVSISSVTRTGIALPAGSVTSLGPLGPATGFGGGGA